MFEVPVAALRPSAVYFPLGLPLARICGAVPPDRGGVFGPTWICTGSPGARCWDCSSWRPPTLSPKQTA